MIVALAATALGALLLAPLARAQTQTPDPSALIVEADRLLQTGMREDAVLTALTAQRRLDEITDASARDRLRAGLVALLARADPQWTRHAEASKADATELIALARSYLRKKLPARAVDLLEEACTLDPKSAAPVLSYAQKQLSSRAASKPETDRAEPDEPVLRDLIGGIESRVAWGTWDLRPTEVRSPHLDGNTVYLIAREPRHGDQRVSVDVLIGDLDGSAALVFGGIDASTYYIVELLHQTDQGTGRYSNLSVHRIVDAKAIEIGRIAFDLSSKQRAGWLQLSVSVRGNRITAGLGALASLRCTAPTVPHGGVGFFVTGNSPNLEPVRFRRLLIEELPLDVPSGAPRDPKPSVALADPVATAIRAALDATEPADDLDARVCALHAQWPRLAEVGNDSERAALALRLTQAIESVDPVGRQANELRVARSARCVAAAVAYHEAGMPRLALRALAAAARFEPTAGSALRKAITQALAPPRAAPLPAAGDCEILAWFDGGETLLGTAGWILGPQGAQSPAGAGTAEQLFAGKRVQPTAGVIGVDLVLPDDPEARAGLVFDLRSAHDLAFAIVDREQDRIRLQVHRYYAGNFTIAGSTLGAALRPGDPAWAHLELRLSGDKVTASIGTGESLEVARAERAAPARLGLFADAPTGLAEFRNFRVAPPAGGSR